jgi:hypothetical protein
MDFRNWFKRNMREYKEDIANYGANAGYPHITYYKDTRKLYRRYTDSIWEIVAGYHEEVGGDWEHFMQGVDDACTFENKMVWTACEIIASEG